MRTIETTVYSFSELSEGAKQTAIEKWRDGTEDFFWSDEWLESIKKGCEAFNGEFTDYSIDCLCIGRSYWIVKGDEDLEITGQRLRTYLLNNYYSNFFEPKPQGEYKKRGNGNWRHDRYSKILYVETGCPFTGYCGDENFMDVFRKFIKTPDNSTFFELLEDAVNNALQGLVEDCENQQSDEYIAEHIEANEYEFTGDGNRI
jgi:hypothetical protein